MIRVGIVGIGFGQHAHLPAFAADARCRVSAVAASRADRAQAVADRFGIAQAYGDWRALVEDAAVDAVAIAVPPVLQPEIAVAALALGKPVFCEKPLGADLAGARRMQDAAARSGRALGVDFELTAVPAWREARRLLRAGALGPLRHAVVSWQTESRASRQGIAGWKTQPEDGGGVLNSLGSHILHALEWLCGPVQRLSCRLHRNAGAEAVAALQLELDGGVPVSAAISSAAAFGTGHRVEIYGDGGALILTNDSKDYVRGFRLWHGARATDTLAPVPVAELPEAPDGRVPAVAVLARQFVDWIETGATEMPSGRDGVRVQELLEAARRSDQAAAWVDTADRAAHAGSAR